MRIIAGSRKGLKIKLPAGSDARPVTDRIKESVFGILAGDVCGAEVLDLFAGPGSFGLEALSRGASGAVFVDSSPECVSAVKANLARMDMEGHVLCCEAAAAVGRLSANAARFGVIFVDPPFESGRDGIDCVLKKIALSGILSSGGVVVVRCHFKTVFSDPPAGLLLFRQKRYGENAVFFYLHEEKSGES